MRKLRRLVVRALRVTLPYPVIVAGLGRCGTTLLYGAIEDRITNPSGFVIDLDSHCFANDLIKTHDYPPEVHLPEGTKVVFMFGNIVDTILSTTDQINDWGQWHYRHVRTPQAYRVNTDLYTNDDLRLEELFDAWYRPQQFDLLTLRYESLYQPGVMQTVQEYLGLTFSLPAYRPRSTNQQAHPATLTVANTYASLSRKIEDAEDVKVWPMRRIG